MNEIVALETTGWMPPAPTRLRALRNAKGTTDPEVIHIAKYLMNRLEETAAAGFRGHASSWVRSEILAGKVAQLFANNGYEAYVWVSWGVADPYYGVRHHFEIKEPQ